MGLIVAILVLFFLGRETDPVTNQTRSVITSNGITQFRQGMDIAGWVRLTYKVDFSKYDQIYSTAAERDQAKRDAIGVILRNIDNRISALGVSDYSALQQNIGNETFLIVEIGWVHSIESAKEIIGKTVELEFKVLASDEEKQDMIPKRKTMAENLFEQIKENPDQLKDLTDWKQGEDVFVTTLIEQDFTTLPPIYANLKDEIINSHSWDIFDLWEGVYLTEDQAWGTAIEWYVLFVTDAISESNSENTTLDSFLWVAGQFDKKSGILTGQTHTENPWSVSYDEENNQFLLYSDLSATAFGWWTGLQVLAIYDVDSREAEDIEYELNNGILVSGTEVLVMKSSDRVPAMSPKNNEILNGAYFAYSTPSVDQFGQPVVTINFNEKWKEIFCNITKAIVNEQMAIFVGGVMQTNPVINEPICGGSAQISGGFDAKGAKELSDNLNEWALPAPLILSQEEKVSPVLGEGAIYGAFLAAGVWLILLFLFLFIFYGLRPALIGVGVMIVFLIYTLAIFKIIDYAFSLSGIAAIILSLGMGIDANIIIYERIREELQDNKSWENTVNDAYIRSRLAIRDGNVTNIIIYIILFGMGMSIFKWFWFAGLIAGLIILFVNVPLTKIMLHVFDKKTSHRSVKHLNNKQKTK